jgi:hypothetical protein
MSSNGSPPELTADPPAIFPAIHRTIGLKCLAIVIRVSLAERFPQREMRLQRMQPPRGRQVDDASLSMSIRARKRADAAICDGLRQRESMRER